LPVIRHGIIEKRKKEIMNNEISAYFITIAAFAFFVVCPRLGAMTNLLDKHTSLSIYWLVIVGTFASIPLLVIMTWLIRHWGLMAGVAHSALAYCPSVV